MKLKTVLIMSVFFNLISLYAMDTLPPEKESILSVRQELQPYLSISSLDLARQAVDNGDVLARELLIKKCFLGLISNFDQREIPWDKLFQKTNVESLTNEELYLMSRPLSKEKFSLDFIGEFSKRANKKDAVAEFILGQMYLLGVGTRQDFSMALYWYSRAEKQGYAFAQFKLGLMYECGELIFIAGKNILLYEQAAKQGLALSQYFLGVMYADGNGVDRDYSKATNWLAKAANQGYADAQFRFAMISLDNYYVDLAIKLFGRAATQGHANAQFKLGLLCDIGQWVFQDYAKAVIWYTKAADQGHVRAQYKSGMMYKNGMGVPKDYAKAFFWFTKAADRGDADAQYNLGLMYQEGLGIPESQELAVFWFAKAAEQGYIDIERKVIVLGTNPSSIGV